MQQLRKLGALGWIVLFLCSGMAIIALYPTAKPLTVVGKAINNRTQDVKQIVVVDANTFDILLFNSKRHLVKLKINAVPDAQTKIIELLHRCKEPRVILIKQENGLWIGDFVLKVNNKSVVLTDWLRRNNLVYT